MQISVKHPYEANVHILPYVPRKVGVRIRDFVAESNRSREAEGLEKIDITQFKGKSEKELENLPMDVIVFLDNLNMVVCQNLIDKVEILGKESEKPEHFNLKDFLEMISDEDYKEISSKTGELYEETMKKVEKKTNKKPN